MSSFVGNTDTLNVLIVVDVQNCFMKNVFSGIDDVTLNQTDEENCIQMAKEIAALTEKNDIAVFTRDLHPLNHISFGEGSEGRTANFKETWPIHCRNPTQKCKSRTETPTEPNRPSFDKKFSELELKFTDESFKQKLTNFIKDKKIGETQIMGNNLSYYFYGTDIGNDILLLNNNNKFGVNKIGMKRSQFENQDKSYDEIQDTNTLDDIKVDAKPNGKFITLTKGERCDQESYSAFNYHQKYNIETPSNPTIDYTFNSVDKNQSTGLWEWILKNKGNAKKINITVCGLVGNVCVMHTVLQGKAMWEKLYKPENPDIEVDFCFSLVGTLFLPKLPPGNLPKVSLNPDHIITQKYGVQIDDKPKPETQFSLKEWMEFNFPKSAGIFGEAFPNVDSLELFTPFDERGAQQMGGKRRSQKCPKCKKNHYHGGKCFVCGFIPFLGKTQKRDKSTTKKRKGRRGKGKRTRKNKRRFSRRR
jgi:nicotinamidase-related amidase